MLRAAKEDKDPTRHHFKTVHFFVNMLKLICFLKHNDEIK